MIKCILIFIQNYHILINILISLFLGVVGVFLTCSANKIARSNFKLANQESERRKNDLSQEDKEIFVQIYSKISESLGLIIQHGDTTEKALELIWQKNDT